MFSRHNPPLPLRSSTVVNVACLLISWLFCEFRKQQREWWVERMHLLLRKWDLVIDGKKNSLLWWQCRGTWQSVRFEHLRGSNARPKAQFSCSMNRFLQTFIAWGKNTCIGGDTSRCRDIISFPDSVTVHNESSCQERMSCGCRRPSFLILWRRGRHFEGFEV